MSLIAMCNPLPYSGTAYEHPAVSPPVFLGVRAAATPTYSSPMFLAVRAAA